MKKFLSFTLLLTAMALLIQPSFAEIVAREGQGRLERVNGQPVLYLKGSHYEIGYQHGVLLREMIAENLRNIIDNQGEIGERTEYRLYRALREGMHNQLIPHIPERFLEEMRGLADGSGLPYEEILAGNLFPEMFHCSGMALMGDATHDGSLYHVRILDFMTDVGLQKYAVVMIVQPDDGNAFLNVGFAGFIGSVTGMNDRRIAIGEMGGAGQGWWDGLAMPLLVRDALERADTLQDALRIFRNTPRTCEYFYVISDGNIRDARGVYATPQRIHFVRPGESYALFDVPPPPHGDSGGHKTMARGVDIEQGAGQMLVTGPDGELMAMINRQPQDTVVISGIDRYRYFIERLMEGYGEVDETALKEMIKRPVSMKSNLHNAIFHPETLRVWVAVADEEGNPACDQPYHLFTLESQNPVAIVDDQQTTGFAQ